MKVLMIYNRQHGVVETPLDERKAWTLQRLQDQDPQETYELIDDSFLTSDEFGSDFEKYLMLLEKVKESDLVVFMQNWNNDSDNILLFQVINYFQQQYVEI